jgi:flagellar biosynthesis chaperone FliJ
MPEVFLNIKAVDAASPVLSEAAKNAEDFRTRVNELAKAVAQGGEAGKAANAEMRELSRQLNADEKAARLLVDAWEDQHKVGLQIVDVMQGVSNMAGKALNMFTQYNTMQIRINQLEEARVEASQRLQAAQDAVTAAQARLNTVVAEYGPGSREAEAAAKDLEKAQKELNKAQTEAEAAERKLAEARNQNLMMMAGFVLQAPAFIKQAINMQKEVMQLGNYISEAGGIMNVFHGGIQMVSGAMSFLAANPIVLVIAAIAALVAGLAWAYENIEPFRNAVNQLADGLVKLGEWILGGLKTAWDTLVGAFNTLCAVLKPVYDFFKGIWDFIQGIFGAPHETTVRVNYEQGTPPEVPPVMMGIPGAQQGGIVVRSGLAYVHKGEPIVPAEIARGMVGGREVVIEKIEVNIEGVLDRDLLRQISEGIGRELRRRGVLG